MARIRTYALDDNVTGSDYWIGTDGNNNSNTKNFSPNSVAKYLNENEVVDVSNSIRFRYDTIDSGKSRGSGTLSFATEIGAVVPINSLTTFILSKNTQSTKLVNAFLNILPGTKIILQKSDYINIFGIFKVISVTQITLEPDFYTVVVEYISGYGSLEEDKDYIISLIDLQGGGGAIKTSDLINDGEDGVNPFITLEDLPPSASTLQEVTDNGNTTSKDIIVENTNYYSIIEPSDVGTQNKNTNAYTYIGADGVVGIKTGTFEGEIKTTDLTAGITLEFPDKVAGTYTIATTDDVSATPGLNEVLVVENQTLGRNIKVNDYDAIELENGSLLRKGTYDFGGFGDIIVSGITNANDGYINGVMGWGNPSGTQWSDLNGNYAKTSVAVTPSGYSNGLQGMHTPEPGTFNYYLELISNPTFNGIAYFLAPGNRSGWGDPDDDTTTDPPVDYWRLCVGSDYPSVYFTNPSSDPYIFPTSGWVPVSDTIPNSEGGYGYDYIANYNEGFTASISYVLNGNGGISRICSQGYEDMWQAGVRYVFGNSGYIRHATNGFDIIPDFSFDYTKRFAVGSLWTLDNGDTYECTNADLNEAVWVLTTVDLSGYIPYTGATEDVDLGVFNITAAQLIKDGGFATQFLKADGSVDNNTYLTSADLPSTLDLYATTASVPGIPGYTALVRNITDSRYDTTAVNVPTPTITGTLASPTFCGAVISDPSILLGNPGVFNFSVIGKIRRAGGSTSSGADFFYSIYKRDISGVETLIADSSPVIVPANGGIYVEYISIALWNNGIFSSTDRVVLKFYGIKSGTGSGATYEFLFGGTDPVRGTAAISSAIIPNLYLRDLADVEKVPAENNEILYWNDPASLWEHELAENLVPLATATQKGLVSTTVQTFAGAKTFTGAITASNLSGTNTGNNATNTQYSGLATSKQDTLQSTVNIKSINGTSILGSGDLVVSGGGGAVDDLDYLLTTSFRTLYNY
jgi:hypothetical protein